MKIFGKKTNATPKPLGAIKLTNRSLATLYCRWTAEDGFIIEDASKYVRDALVQCDKENGMDHGPEIQLEPHTYFEITGKL